MEKRREGSRPPTALDGGLGSTQIRTVVVSPFGGVKEVREMFAEMRYHLEEHVMSMSTGMPSSRPLPIDTPGSLLLPDCPTRESDELLE